ncbi:MAG: hypothetical protein MUC95_03530, partial [Spirochaetes bacterium]|nr:hypothetical protein [Spirochaetota bacterium]
RHPDSVIYKFYKNNGRLAVWQIYAGKIKFKEMNFLETDKLSEISGINQIINSEKDDKINYKFIILNDTILDILKAGRETIPGVMYIPSIERASHYKMPKAVSIKNIFYNGTGIRDRLSAGKELIIDEGSGLNTDLTRYSVIIDNSNILNTQRLFSERLEPALVIKNAAGWDIDRINFFLEASLYSGIKSTVLCFGSLNAAEASGIMAEASQKSFDSISCSANQNTALIAAGFRGYDISERKTLLPGIKNNELEQFRSKLQDCRPDEANTHLQKWFNISGDDPSGDEITYNLSMSEIELMAGNPGGSLDYAGKAENLSSASYPELNAEAQSLSVYIALYNGELMTAGKLLGSTNNQIFKNSADFSIYQSIIDISSGNSAPSIEKYKNLISKTPLLPVNRLKLIYADYLNTLKYDMTARTVLADWRGNFTLSGRDALLVTLLKAEIEDIKYPSQRSGDINKLKNSPLDAEEIKNRAALLLENNGSYDMLTPFTLLYAANRLIEKKDRDSAIALIDDINFEKLLSESKWNDALLALSLAIKLYDSEKRYDDSLRCIRYAISIARSRTLTFAVRYLTYKEAVTLVMLGRHKESYDSASAGLSLAEKDEDLLIRYQLLLMEDELFLGKTAEAALREEKIKTTGKPEYLYLLNLLKARIEMLKILGGSKSADTDWATIEKHITASLENIDSSPDVLNKFNRMDLLKESLNILISYKMSRKDIYRALYYNEIKKQLELRSKLPYLAEKDKIPADIIRQFKITSDEKICTQLLKKNPLLQINALAGILPLNSYQKKIPKDAVTIYLGAFENDILGWVITEKDVNGVRIKDGFIKVDDILKKYQDDISRMKSTMDTSKKLYLLLKDLERYYKDKKIIIFITDNELEQIPFEITGETNMLDETHAIIYAPSILSSFLNFNDGNNNVNITGNSNGSVLNSLDLISIKESGIPYSTGKTQPSGISHIQGKISFDTENGYLYIDDSMFFESTGKAGIIYIPDFSIGNKITLNELSNKNSIYGIKATIINDSRIQDVNNAIFINSFYGGIMEKKNIIAAFRQAKEAVRTNKKYSNPCYWAGIRLFFNGSLNY